MKTWQMMWSVCFFHQTGRIVSGKCLMDKVHAKYTCRQSQGEHTEVSSGLVPLVSHSGWSVCVPTP